MNNIPTPVAMPTTLPREGVPGKLVLSARGLTKRFTEGRLDVTVLQGVDMDVYAGDTLAIIGASGSGKSTLLHLLGGLDAPTSGTVMLLGQDLAHQSAAAQGRLRNQHLGFVYQFHHLLPEFSALDNVAMPLWIRRMARTDAAQVATKMLASVGLDGRLHHRPAELSGGERQRVAIARALVTQPKIILADEPTANLDSVTGTAILDLMQELNRGGTTFLFSTHDPRVVSRAGRVIRLIDGQIVQEDAAAGAVAAAISIH